MCLSMVWGILLELIIKNMNKEIVVIGIILFATIGIFAYLIIHLDKDMYGEKNESILEKNIPEKKEEKILQEISPIPQNIYFGVFENEKYKLINLSTEEEKEFIPKGFQIVDMNNYGNNPKFLILRKSNELYSFEVANGEIKKIVNGSVLYNEKVNVYSSMTEDGKFYLSVKKIGGASDFGTLIVVANRDYLLDIEENRLIPTPKLVALDVNVRCQEYDSKFKRFFFWISGEGASTFLPFSFYDLNKGVENELIALGKRDNFTSFDFDGGLFFAGIKDGGIVVIKPDKDISQESFLFSNEIKNKLPEEGFRSMLYVENKNTIVAGGGDGIGLFKFIDHEIVDYKYISESSAYANFIFTDYERVYYKPEYKNQINVLNLSTWELEKVIYFHNEGNPHAINIFTLGRI